MNIRNIVFGMLLYGVFIGEAGAAMKKNINAQDAKGRTKLHYAAIKEDPKKVDNLLNSGANPNLQDKEGKTPLHYAAAGSTNCMEIVSNLLEHKADHTIKDNKGNIPGDLADNGGILHIFMDTCGYKMPGGSTADDTCHICRGIYGKQSDLKTFVCGHQCHESCYKLFSCVKDTSGDCPICYMNKH